MLVVGEKVVQANTELVVENEKTANENSVDVEAVLTTNDADEALQHLERLRKQYGVSHDDLYSNSSMPSKDEPNRSPLF